MVIKTDPIVSEVIVDTSQVKKAWQEVKRFARDTKKELDQKVLIELQTNALKIEDELKDVKMQLKDPNLTRPEEIQLRIRQGELKSNLTEARRQLQNYRNTWDRELSRLQAKFNSVNDTINKQWDALRQIASWDIIWWIQAIWTWFKGASVWATALNLALAPLVIAVWTFAALVPTFFNLASAQQKYNAVLTNSLWSQEQAAQSLELIRDVASRTPFEINKLTESYIKLVNRWFKPTEQEIIRLWDLAASQWKDFDQLVEALLDAQTWEFERLKEFGIRARAQWDQVAFTFKWVTTEVQKTDEAIKNYILWLWTLDWVQGNMVEQSKTLWWQFSNLADTATQLWTRIGQALAPAFSVLIKWANNALMFLENLFFVNIPTVLAVAQWEFNKTTTRIAAWFNVIPIAVRSAVNIAIKSIENLINWAIWWVNKLLSVINQIPWVESTIWNLAFNPVSLDSFLSDWLSADNLQTTLKQELWRIEEQTFKRLTKIQWWTKSLVWWINTELSKIWSDSWVSWWWSSWWGGWWKVWKQFEDLRKFAEDTFKIIADNAKKRADDVAKRTSDLAWRVKWLIQWFWQSIEDQKSKIKDFTDQISDANSKIDQARNKINDINQSTTEQLAWRLQTIQSEIWEATAWNDTEKLSALREELDLINWLKNIDEIRAQVAENERRERLTTAEKILEDAQKEIDLQNDIIAIEQDRIAKLQEQKEQEKLVLEAFQAKQIKLEENYTKRFGEELEKRLDLVKNFQQRVRTATLWNTTAQTQPINNTNTSTQNINVTVDWVSNPEEVRQAVTEAITQASVEKNLSNI